MAERYFKLKDAKAEQETSIRLYVFHRNFPHRRFVYGLKKSILPALWDAETQRPTKDKKLIKEYEKFIPTIANDLLDITRKLDDVNTKVNNYFTMASIPENGITISSESLKNHLESQFNKKIESETKKKIETLSQYIKRYISELEQGIRVISKTGKRLEDGSIKNFKTFESQLNEYQKKRKVQLGFSDITLDFYNDFVRYLNEKDYRANTIGKHIARLKVIMRESMKDKLHENSEFSQGDFYTFQVETDEVYLTQQEVQTLHNFDLSDKPHLQIYRDVFLIGCYTAQRVSDYNGIKPENIQHLNNNKVIVLTQKKTKEKVIIPIKNELDAILKRYNNAPPKVAEQKLNEAIKEICKLAGIKQATDITELKGGESVKITKPKYEMITSHTARRTGATLMYLSKIPSIAIMKITGHKKESTFLKYIRVTKEENAETLATHDYFQ
jgi:integrase